MPARRTSNRLRNGLSSYYALSRYYRWTSCLERASARSWNFTLKPGWAWNYVCTNLVIRGIVQDLDVVHILLGLWTTIVLVRELVYRMILCANCTDTCPPMT